MGPNSQKLTQEKRYCRGKMQNSDTKQQTIQRQLTAKWTDSEILHRHKLSEGVCSERNIEDIS